MMMMNRSWTRSSRSIGDLEVILSSVRKMPALFDWLVDSWSRIAVWQIPRDFFLQEEDLLGPEAPRQGSSLSRRFVMLLGLKFGMVMKEVVVMLVSQVVVGYFKKHSSSLFFVEVIMGMCSIKLWS